jgi:hypothetical protein
MANEEVERRADKVQEDDDQHPAYSLVVGDAFVLNGGNEHPNPEHHAQQSQRDEKKQEEDSKPAKS